MPCPRYANTTLKLLSAYVVIGTGISVKQDYEGRRMICSELGYERSMRGGRTQIGTPESKSPKEQRAAYKLPAVPTEKLPTLELRMATLLPSWRDRGFT